MPNVTLEDFVNRGRKAQESVNEIMTNCVKCGHTRKDHYKERGQCKHKEMCLCGRYVGR